MKALLQQLFSRKPKSDGLLTDDKKELRDYEENVYMAESGVTEASYAEFVITTHIMTISFEIV